MRVSRLALDDFRSYRDLLVEFPAGLVTLVGRNGAGKTNIVEAIRYIGAMSSHRVAGDAALVRVGADRATIRATVEKAGRSLHLEVTIAAGGTNTARLNSSPTKPREIAGILRTVVFSPEDLDLVKGEPSGRRRFLDDVGTALSPMLAGDLSDYDRVIRQRSTLLKTARGKHLESAALDVWDDKLAQLGARITRSRLDATMALLPHVSREYSDITLGSDPCSVRYLASADTEGDFATLSIAEIEARLLRAMEHERAREIERGMCLVGPHRDEMEIRIGTLPARGYASHGESWSAALALRLGTYALLTAEGGPDADLDGEPVLILDDVFAELDATRRSALASRVSGAHQVIVTAAVVEDVPTSLGGRILMVEEGKVKDHGER